MSDKVLYDLAKRTLPKIADTQTLPLEDREDYWREQFLALWGGGDLEILKGNLPDMTGAFSSQKIGQLTFSCIDFGSQSFERNSKDLNKLDEPFYSLTFPKYGQAICKIGDKIVTLSPHHTFLLNNSMAAKLQVPEAYGTFNVKIPTTALEDRIGFKPDILDREIMTPDVVFHMMQRTIGDLISNVDQIDEQTSNFVNNQLLDAISYYLSSGGQASEESIAMETHKSNVIDYIDKNYKNEKLNPAEIAKACRISKSYLYKLFSNTESVMERVKKKRLDAARKNIINNHYNMTMTQIAYSCGFKSSSEFSRLFKLEYGVSPRSYTH